MTRDLKNERGLLNDRHFVTVCSSKLGLRGCVTVLSLVTKRQPGEGRATALWAGVPHTNPTFSKRCMSRPIWSRPG